MQRLEDAPKETLISIIKATYCQLEQKVLCYPSRVPGNQKHIDLSIYQPTNCLVNVIHETGKFDPSKDEANYLPFSTMAIKYLKDAGCKIITSDGKEL